MISRERPLGHLALVTVLAGTTLSMTATTASAGWSASASGSGKGRAGSLGQVINLATSSTPSCAVSGEKMNVPLSWSSLANAGGYTVAYAPTGNLKQATSPSGTMSVTTTAATLSLGSSGSGNSGYTITVQGTRANWRGAVSASISVATLNCP